MAVTVDLSGVPEFQKVLGRAVDMGLARAALVYETANRQIMQTTGPRAGVGAGVAGRNIPSRPGEPPAVQLGQLRQSQTSERGAGLFPIYHVGTSSIVGRWMEFGTSTIAPRPWLAPNLYSVQNRRRAHGEFSSTVQLELTKAIAGANAGAKR